MRKVVRAFGMGAVALMGMALAVGLLADGAAAGPGDPPGITDYASYPDAIVPTLYPAGCSARQAGVLVGESYSVTDDTGTRTGTDIEALGTIVPGSVMTMTWTGFAAGCESTGISFSVKRADAPVFDATTNQELMTEAYDYCGPLGESCATKANTLTITQPPARLVCNYQIDSVVGPPLAIVGPRGSYYNNNVRIANGKPAGEDMLIHANNGGPGDCGAPEPTAEINLACSTPGATLTLGNTGELDSTFTVTVTGGSAPSTETFDIGPGVTGVTRDVVMPEGATRTVTVEADGATILGPQTFTRDCESPAASIAHSCGSDSAVFSLTNTGPNAATVQVSFGDTTQDVTIPGGTAADPGTAEVSFPVVEDGTYTASVTDVVNGATVLLESDEWVQNCVELLAAIAPECSNGGALVTVTNSGENATTVDITVDGVVVVDDLAVPGGGVPVVSEVVVAEDATVTVEVVDAGGTVVGTVEFTRDCEDAGATFELECAAGGVVVALTNAGENPVALDVSKGDEVVADDVVVGADPVEVVVEMAEDETATITVTGPQGEVGSAEFTRDCLDSGAEFDAECVNTTDGQLTVTITNDGEIEAEYVITADDDELDTVTVPAGETFEQDYEVLPGLPVTVAVTGEEGVVGSEEVTVTCVAPNVIPRTPPAAPTLPRTGSDTGLLLTLGGILLVLGGAALALGELRANRRRAHLA